MAKFAPIRSRCDGERTEALEQGTTQAEGEGPEEDQRFSTLHQAARDSRLMKIEGSARSNLISAITSVRRWRGRRVHGDTLAYWHAVLDQGRRSTGEPVADLVAELEGELARSGRHTQ